MKIEKLNAVDFKNWQEHPVTQVILQFLADIVKEKSVELIDSMGSMNPNNISFIADAAGRVKAYSSLQEISAEEINNFYGFNDDSDDDSDGDNKNV
jgi:hypothetical protein